MQTETTQTELSEAISAKRFDAQRTLARGFVVLIQNWSGQVKPFRGVVYSGDGKRCGITGYCSSHSGVESAAWKVVAKAEAK